MSTHKRTFSLTKACNLTTAADFEYLKSILKRSQVLQEKEEAETFVQPTIRGLDDPDIFTFTSRDKAQVIHQGIVAMKKELNELDQEIMKNKVQEKRLGKLRKDLKILKRGDSYEPNTNVQRRIKKIQTNEKWTNPEAIGWSSYLSTQKKDLDDLKMDVQFYDCQKGYAKYCEKSKENKSYLFYERRMMSLMMNDKKTAGAKEQIESIKRRIEQLKNEIESTKQEAQAQNKKNIVLKKELQTLESTKLSEFDKKMNQLQQNIPKSSRFQQIIQIISSELKFIKQIRNLDIKERNKRLKQRPNHKEFMKNQQQIAKDLSNKVQQEKKKRRQSIIT